MKSKERYYNVLKNLAVYKFLTLEQMLTLEIGKNKQSISAETASLIRDGLANSARKDRFSRSVYHLTKKGAKRAEHIYDITPRYPRSKLEEIPQDMEHRLAIVDFHISIRGFDIVQHWREFDYIGSQRQRNLQKVSKIPLGRTSITPDLIFKLRTERGNRLYLAEIERTKGKTADAYFKDKLDKYIALSQNRTTVKEKFNIEQMYTVLFIVDDLKFMKDIQKKIRNDKRIKEHKIKKVGETFLFKHFDDDVFTWVNLDGKARLLYY